MCGVCVCVVCVRVCVCVCVCVRVCVRARARDVRDLAWHYELALDNQASVSACLHGQQDNSDLPWYGCAERVFLFQPTHCRGRTNANAHESA
jgi:hypothetical protein